LQLLPLEELLAGLFTELHNYSSYNFFVDSLLKPAGFLIFFFIMTLRLNGDTSGFTEIKAPSEAGDNSLTLPVNNGGAHSILKNSNTAGELQFASGVFIDNSNRLIVGNTTSQGFNSTLQVRKDFDGRSVEIFRSFESNTTPGRIQFSTSRGTETTPLVMQDGGEIAQVRFSGYDGSSYVDAAQISAEVSGAPGGSVMPGKITFSTNGGGATVTPRVEIGSDGALKLLSDCPGIDFSAINGSTRNSAVTGDEVLDHYEQGTWTPVVSRLSSAPTTVTYTNNREGTYTRVGNKVCVFYDVTPSEVTGGSGPATIDGLPFLIDGNMAGYSRSHTRDAEGIVAGSAGTQLIGFAQKFNDYIYYQLDNSGTNGFDTNSGASWKTSGGRITGYLEYTAP